MKQGHVASFNETGTNASSDRRLTPVNPPCRQWMLYEAKSGAFVMTLYRECETG